MSSHLVLGSALVLALTTPVVATAAPGPACQSTKDDKGDVYALRNAADQKTPDPALDLVSADVASNASTLTAVIRVDKLGSPSTAPSGVNYSLTFNVSGSELLYYASATRGPAMTGFDFGSRENLPAVTSVSTSRGVPAGTFDEGTSEVRISVPLTMFGDSVKFVLGKTKVSVVEVFSSRGAAHRGPFADDAAGGKSYVHGTKNCVVVGK
ncbi:MAG TPA: hypothetical protein VNB94_05965 [Mycobacteriales bacterium]|nr:hypothetical protein [Mycobacteriales bacterium]